MQRTEQTTRRRFLKRAAAGGLAACLPAGLARATTTTRPAVKSVGLVYDERYLKHSTGEGHPERPERLTAIIKGLRAGGLMDRLVRIKPRPAAAATVQLVHSADYVRLVRRETAAGRRSLSTGDTAIGPGSDAVALLAAGGVTAAVDAVCTGRVRRAFCAVRPPGHHARPGGRATSRTSALGRSLNLRDSSGALAPGVVPRTGGGGMGFCIFNNAAIAVRYARKKHGVRRALIVDWDVHHGNGTQAAFYADPSVLFFDTHQSPWYPFTGAADETGRGKGKGTTINVPLPAGTGEKEILQAYRKRLVPAAERFKPDLVVISAGFDSRKGDPLGGFTVTDKGFAQLTRVVVGLAERHAKGRVVSTLEGGYDLAGLATAARAHVEALLPAGK